MERTKHNMYDVNSYTDEELYELLDLVNPSDSVLEAKIIQMIKKYNTIHNKNGEQLAQFFKDVYVHFFYVNELVSPNTKPNPENDDREKETPLQEGFDVNNTNMEISQKTQQNWMKQIQDKRAKTTTATNDQTKTKTKTAIDAKTGALTTTNLNYVKDYINPLLKQTIRRIISVDSQFRGPLHPISTDFTFNLSEPLKDVVELSLSSVQIPYTWYTVTNSYGANYFYLKGITEGINYGNFDYKIEIDPGNYNPDPLITAINQSISTMKTNNPDVYFGNTNLSYNSSTNLTTTTIELVNIFNETSYYLEFEVDPVIYVNSNVTLNDYNRKNNDHNVGGYFGYNCQTYYPNSICSARNLPPPTVVEPYIIDPITGIFINTNDGTSAKLITDGNYNGEINGQKYYLDTNNNYFNIVLYQGPDEYNASTTTSLKNIKITLSNLATENSHTRIDILDEVNRQLTLNEYFMGDTTYLKRVYINDPSMVNFKSSYFQFTLNWNKRKIPNNTKNMKTVIIFPDETNNQQQSTCIWVRDAVNLAKSSCFNFLQIHNELNNLTAETASLETNYVITSHPYIELVCIEDGYTNAENTYQVVVEASYLGGYSLLDYLAAINNGFQVVNQNTTKYNPPGGILQNSYIENTDRVHIYFDLVKVFNNQYYDLNMSANNNCFISLDPTSPVNALYQTGMTTTLPTTINANQIPVIDLSENLVLNFNWSTSNSFKIDQTNFLSIIPKLGYHNSNAATWNVPTNDTLRGINGSLITYISDFTRNIQDTLTSFQDAEALNSYPLRNTTVNYQFYSYDVATSVTTYTITINLVINKYLNQNSYQVRFQDPGSATFEGGSWYNFLQIGNFSYNLIDYDVPEKPYSLISSVNPIQTNVLNLKADTTIKIKPYVDGVTSLTGANILSIEIQQGSYTKEQLLTLINVQFSANPITQGSVIKSVIVDGTYYVNIRLNINKIYTANDYSLVFYDLYSFVKCYVGVKSVRNVTWDSTLGWILGYRSQTDYTLSDVAGSFTKVLIGDTTVITSLYNYFLIKLDDYTQSHMNDGLVTLTNTDTSVPLPPYAYLDNFQCDPTTGKKIFTGTTTSDGKQLLTQNQMYAIQEIMNSRQQQQSIQQKYTKGLFTQDIFGLIPIKTSGLPNGGSYIEFGGTLQNQQRTYFGPVNISRLTIQLLNDRGDVVDLNGANWLCLSCVSNYINKNRCDKVVPNIFYINK